ncbi:EAL domain-containing protein [[Eubacterium] hominis]|uniref:EAL domain-containing protein n=1 Tax=[Eubacterium] hominis TaxID=2764325 RepID=UPI003A4DC4BF
MIEETLTELKIYYKQALHSDKHYALMNMNIKKFRYLNYAYGKEAADQMLQVVEQFLCDFIKEDGIAKQIYADDYVMIVTYETAQQLEKKWLYDIVDAIFEIDHPILYHNIYTSFGIFLMDTKDVPFEEACEKAQFSRIMCESLKRRAFSYEFYNQKLYDDYMNACYLEEYSAKAREKGFYQVYIQPKVDLKTREITGGEALLRLFDQGELIPVSKFLPMLNKNGYIRMIDLQVFETVLKEIQTRLQLGKPMVRISFNISNSFFYDEFIIQDYRNVLEKYDVDRSYLELEFMENISTNEEKMKEHIRSFHEMGFYCSLDDFGNGFSNFNLLKDSNLDVIKIDRCFFQEKLSEDAKEILRTIIHLIKILGMEVIAEGVERKEDIDFLSTIDCDAVQGFYFYKPMPMKDFFDLIDQTKTRQDS